MIPLYRPPFGLETAFKAALGIGRSTSSLHHLEEAFAAACGCEEALWLPSVRAGICWGLRAAIGRQTTVIGPAFTCPVVHEAMFRSGGKVRLIDAAEVGFGMAQKELQTATCGDYALVLSEPYGHVCDALEIEGGLPASSPKIRIFDSAMSFPHPHLFERLERNDLLLIGLGKGKNMFSGWGGVGFTRDRKLAREARKMRDSWLQRGRPGLAIIRALSLTLRAAAHHPSAYEVCLGIHNQLKAVRSRFTRTPTPPSGITESARDTAVSSFPAAGSSDRCCSPEWRFPSTYMDRRLALWNLESMDINSAKQLKLAGRYHENFADTPGVLRPPASSFALSHYTVRVEARIRDEVKERLYRSGVYADSFWQLQPHVDRREYPRAIRLSSEMINLPISPWMDTNQVDHVCDLLKRHLVHLSTN